MHLAARCGQADALKALLEDLDTEERVAFLNDADKNGITPVFLAKQKGEFLFQERVAFLNDAKKNVITSVLVAKQKGEHLAQMPLLGVGSLPV